MPPIYLDMTTLFPKWRDHHERYFSRAGDKTHDGEQIYAPFHIDHPPPSASRDHRAASDFVAAARLPGVFCIVPSCNIGFGPGIDFILLQNVFSTQKGLLKASREVEDFWAKNPSRAALERAKSYQWPFCADGPMRFGVSTSQRYRGLYATCHAHTSVCGVYTRLSHLDWNVQEIPTPRVGGAKRKMLDTGPDSAFTTPEKKKNRATTKGPPTVKSPSSVQSSASSTPSSVSPIAPRSCFLCQARYHSSFINHFAEACNLALPKKVLVISKGADQRAQLGVKEEEEEDYYVSDAFLALLMDLGLVMDE